MAFAFVTTDLTGRGTHVEHAPDDFLIGARSATRHGTRYCTDIGTVQVEADALGQILDGTLPQTGIRACGAGLSTVVTLVDAADQSVVGAAFHVRVGANHLMRVHGGLPFSGLT
jgi:hypothetical protein